MYKPSIDGYVKNWKGLPNFVLKNISENEI